MQDSVTVDRHDTVQASARQLSVGTQILEWTTFVIPLLNFDPARIGADQRSTKHRVKTGSVYVKIY